MQHLCITLQGLDDYKAKYAVDEVHYVEDMPKVLAKLQPVSLHLLSGTNTDRYIRQQELLHLAQVFLFLCLSCELACKAPDMSLICVLMVWCMLFDPVLLRLRRAATNRGHNYVSCAAQKVINDILCTAP